jgi:hypothetical protein
VVIAACTCASIRRDVGAGGDRATVFGDFRDHVLFDPDRCSQPQLRGFDVQELGVLDDEAGHRLLLWFANIARAAPSNRTTLSPMSRHNSISTSIARARAVSAFTRRGFWIL